MIGPQGHSVTLEVDEKCIRVARKNLERAALVSRVRLEHGHAQVLLNGWWMERNSRLTWSSSMPTNPELSGVSGLRGEADPSGSLILADNVIRDGKKLTQIAENYFSGGKFRSSTRNWRCTLKLETIVVTVTWRASIRPRHRAPLAI